MNLSSTKLSVNNLFHFVNSECHVDSWKRKVYYIYIYIYANLSLLLSIMYFLMSIHHNIRNASRYLKPLSSIYLVKDLLKVFFLIFFIFIFIFIFFFLQSIFNKIVQIFTTLHIFYIFYTFSKTMYI